jgi:hypothetical protein
MKLITMLAASLLMLICVLPVFPRDVTDHAAPHDWQAVRDKEKQQDYVIEKAAEDISDNITLLCSVLQELDEGSVAGWYVHTADKLPSQPVAVIELMAASHVEVQDMCPRQFYEGTEHHVMEAWMKKAMKALSAFAMTDIHKDTIRRRCLEEIGIALNERDKWQP